MNLQVERGVILQIDFFGDFLSLTSLEHLTHALQGCLFQLEAVQSVLNNFDLCFFGSIKQEELL